MVAYWLRARRRPAIARSASGRDAPSNSGRRQGITIGDLAGILAIADAKAQLRKEPAAGLKNKRRLLEAADVADLAQVKLVAGVGFEPTTFRL